MTPSADVFWLAEANLWWPMADANPLKNWRFAMNRVADSDLTVRQCGQRRVCVQAGAYSGMWPLRLARSFGQVHTFEVMPGMLEAARRNCANTPNISVSGRGLGATVGEELALVPKATAGSWHVDATLPVGENRALMTTIDALELPVCDAIILDIEGFEVEALTGAAETIGRFRPVIHVEELPRSRDAIRAHVTGLGYREARRIHGDAIYVPAERP